MAFRCFVTCCSAGPMAGFAGNSQFGDMRIGGGLFSIGVGQLWLGTGRVAVDAIVIPLAIAVLSQFTGRSQERGFGRHPSLFAEEKHKRQFAKLPAVAPREPVELHMVRTGRECNLVLVETQRTGALLNTDVIAPVAFGQSIGDAAMHEFDIVKVADDRLGVCDLRHRTMPGGVPCGIFARMTLFAGVGGYEAAIGNFDRSMRFGFDRRRTGLAPPVTERCEGSNRQQHGDDARDPPQQFLKRNRREQDDYKY